LLAVGLGLLDVARNLPDPGASACGKSPMGGLRMFVSATNHLSTANRPGVTDPVAETGNQAKV
jgi:hypothetical protein